MTRTFHHAPVTVSLAWILTPDAWTDAHPAGPIQLHLERKGREGIKGTVVLPEGVPGTFIWGGSTLRLKPGSQEVQL